MRFEGAEEHTYFGFADDPEEPPNRSSILETSAFMERLECNDKRVAEMRSQEKEKKNRVRHYFEKKMKSER